MSVRWKRDYDCGRYSRGWVRAAAMTFCNRTGFDLDRATVKRLADATMMAERRGEVAHASESQSDLDGFWFECAEHLIGLMLQQQREYLLPMDYPSARGGPP